MKPWQFSAMIALRRGEKLHGVLLSELKDDGLIFLQQSLEEWLPTPEGVTQFNTMAAELETGKIKTQTNN